MTTSPDISYALTDDWQAAWQPMIDAIGQDFSGGVKSSAIDLIEAGAVRRYCEPLEFGCPLHHDAAVAREHGYRDILAPVAGISSTWIDPGQWKPGMPTNYPNADPNFDSIHDLVPEARTAEPPTPPTSAGFATDIEIEYHEPPCVGDRLTTSGRKLLSVTPRETSVGRGAFMVWETQIHNQREELVARSRTGVYLYVPHQRTAGAPGAAPSARPSGPIMAAIAPKAPLPAAQPVDWSVQRYFEDVHVGDEIAPVVFNMTIFRLVVETGTNRDFHQIHHNTVVAQGQGAPDMYANNGFIQGMWERAVREYIGVAGRFKKTGPFRMKTFNNVGESVITRGTVKRTWVEGNEHLVEIEVWSEHSRGVSVGPGPVVVSLPSRG